MITQKELKERLHYNPNTGIFTWILPHKKATKAAAKIGGVAGRFDKYGYRRISVNGKEYLAHRLAWLYMTGRLPCDQLDHINHIRDDNRWANLREATNSDNQKNSSLQKNNKSGIAGVMWYKYTNRWLVRINTNPKMISLGYHKDFFEACCIRKSAENKYGFHANHGGAKHLTKAEVMEFLENAAEVGE